MNRTPKKCTLSPVNASQPSIYPLGETAMTLDLGNCIDEELNTRALAICDYLKNRPFPGLIDIIVAYSSVSVFHDPASSNRAAISQTLLEAWRQTCEIAPPEAGRCIRVPVCYEGEYGPDLEGVAREKGLTPRDVIDLHCSIAYRIYMIGFLPGFPYMGKIDPRIDMPRKARPAPVIAGGVGIAGMQTGIYPLNSSGCLTRMPTHRSASGPATGLNFIRSRSRNFKPAGHHNPFFLTLDIPVFTGAADLPSILHL
jgi:inhibitor of KinA